VWCRVCIVCVVLRLLGVAHVLVWCRVCIVCVVLHLAPPLQIIV
jgi:hypothetical protein